MAKRTRKTTVRHARVDNDTAELDRLLAELFGPDANVEHEDLDE